MKVAPSSLQPSLWDYLLISLKSYLAFYPQLLHQATPFYYREYLLANTYLQIQILLRRIVVKTKHQYKHGNALTKDEETLLLETYKYTKFELLFALVLYTGLRPNEYTTAKVNGNFIIAINSKRKNKKVEYKRIPITPMLAPYITENTIFEFPFKGTLNSKFKAVLPNHILYDLRTTFYTRCKECGIADAARDEFVGHSLGALGNAYTDLSDEYLLKEGEKFKY